METKAKPLLQSHISFDLNFEMKAFSKYIDWPNLSEFIIKCIVSAIAPSSVVEHFKNNRITYSIHMLYIFHLYVTFLLLYFFYFYFLIFFETGFFCVSLVVLELTL